MIDLLKLAAKDRAVRYVGHHAITMEEHQWNELVDLMEEMLLQLSQDQLDNILSEYSE